MVTVRLAESIEKRLQIAAKRAGKSMASLAREAIVTRIDELEAEYCEEQQAEHKRPRKSKK